MTKTAYKPTRVAERNFDGVDLVIAQAMLMQGLGPDAGSWLVLRPEPGIAVLELSPLDRSTLMGIARTSDEQDTLGWTMLASVGLCEQAVDECGELWRGCAESGIAWLCAERSDELAVLFTSGLSGGRLVVDETVPLETLLTAATLDARLVNV